ncbi:MAG: hypothetical protein KDB68_02070 [Planctomycetes bacterium]|nr:hypothetical protein [Planctomycetota bacterium]
MLAESSSERGQRRAEAEGLERQEDYDAWREEQAAEKAEVRANHMIAMMDQVDRKQFKPLFVFLARCCERANGNARENLASVVTALIAYTKAEKSKVKEVDRVRVPKIGFDDVASYFVEFGLIKSKRALGTRHQWMYWNMPRLAREFFGSENPAKLGPKFYNMKKNELGISDAEWLRRHLGWGAKRVSR